MKKHEEKKCSSGESHDEDAFMVSEFIFSKQMQFKMYIYIEL